jgi:excisionase family DNA binding protein
MDGALNTEPLLTTEEVARQLAVSEDTLTTWRSRKQEIPFVKVGRLVRYRPQDVHTYLEEHLQVAR